MGLKTLFSAIAFLFLFPHMMYAQDSPEKPSRGFQLRYVDVGVGPNVSNVNGATIYGGLVARVAGQWETSVRARYAIFEPINTPPDYSQSNFLFGESDGPYSGLFSAAACIRRSFMRPDGPLNFSVEAGPAFVSYRQLHFMPNFDGGWFGDSHITIPYWSMSAGLAARATGQFRPHPNFGLEVGISTVVNQLLTVTSIDFGLAIGKVRDKSHGQK